LESDGIEFTTGGEEENRAEKKEVK